MKSAMKRAAGGVALTMVLIRGFCGGGSFFGLLRNRRPSVIRHGVMVNEIVLTWLVI